VVNIRHIPGKSASNTGLWPDQARDFSWSTDSLAACDVLTTLTELAADAVAEANIDDRSGGHYYAKWQRYGLGPIDLNFIEVAAQRVRRTPTMVARSDRADYDLLFLKRGPGRFRHYRRDLVVAESTFVLLDNAEPYELLFPRGTLCLTAHLDDKWLSRWLPDPKHYAAQAIVGDRGWGAPLAAMLTAIADEGLGQLVLSRSALADHFGATLALMFDSAPKASGKKGSQLMTRLQRVMHEQYDDPDLDPERVAATVGISKRHLHTVFAAAGTSFGRTLADMRLGRAEKMLRDARFQSSYVADIATACGFSDQSYFARCFRARFGLTPLAFRLNSNGKVPVKRLAPKD
jgi:AraC-like DNA-binding protein